MSISNGYFASEKELLLFVTLLLLVIVIHLQNENSFCLLLITRGQRDTDNINSMIAIR
jgi:hypothetical protein